MDQLAWVAVDWGTSSLRIWGLDKQQNILFQKSSSQGMSSISSPAQFEVVLLQHINDCLPAYGVVPIICCGMVGAKQGWYDAGYQSLPCNPLQQQNAVRIPATDSRLQVWLVPGLCQSQPADVMRGEETQIAGVLVTYPQFSGVVCLPGTHSKWALCDAGSVMSFTTYMTGEMFALLSQHSVLRFSTAASHWQDEAFLQAVQETLADPAGVSRQLFSVRAADVLGQSEGAAGKSRLSGLLIGLELAGAKDMWQGKKVHLVGGDMLAELYQRALYSVGVDCELHSGDAFVLAGLQAVHKQLMS